MARLKQFYIGQKSYVLNFKLGFFLFCLVFFILFCSLSLWQLQRFHIKKQLLNSYHQLSLLPAQEFSKIISNAPIQFQSIRAQGKYLSALTILMQNRFYHDQLGYEVLTPFKMEGDPKLLLVDRGWISVDQMHAWSVNKNVKEKISGYIKFLNDHSFTLGKNILGTHQVPLVVQKIDLNEIGQIYHQVFYPFILRLSPNQSHGFVRDWVILSIMPERHLVYCIQWLAMAIVLLIALIISSFERVNDEE